MSDRRDQCVAHFQECMRTIATPAPLPKEAWMALAPETDTTSLHYPFGYLPIYWHEQTSRFFFAFCPDLIVEQCAILDDRLFGDYLTWMQAHVHLHMQHDPDADEPDIDWMMVEAVVDSALYDMAPKSTEIAGRVQMRALDLAV